MIIILKSDTTEDQIGAITDHIASLEMQAHVSRGTFRTIIGVIGDESSIDSDQIKSFTGVSDVVRVLPPYKLASLEAHPQPSVVEVGKTKIGGGHLAMVAGPCSIESEERMDIIAAAVKASGANILRGGGLQAQNQSLFISGHGG